MKNYLLPKEIEFRIFNNYPFRWAKAMTHQEEINRVMSFIERNTELDVTYEQVFFATSGFEIYEKDGEKRLFSSDNGLFKLVPATMEDAEGDWQLWLKEAKLIKKYE